MQELEEGVDRPTSITELEEAIGKYNGRIRDIVLAQERIGVWYKMLGTRYYDAKMYKLAYDSFRSAIEYYPGNKNLFYKCGLCAVQMAHSRIELSENDKANGELNYYSIAEKNFLRSIELDDKYDRAKMSLAILYIFDLNKPNEGIALLEPIIQKESKPFEELFAVGRAYIMIGEYEKALQAYDRVISNSRSKKQKEAAKKIRTALVEGMNK